jgi:hypothetical protein
VPGYSDTDNMWVKLMNIEKQEYFSTKFPNDKSLVTIQVSDRIFKLRKNPHYKNENALF